MTLPTVSRQGAGDLLLCFHGLGCVKESFVPLFEAESLADMAILVPDLPGHGDSSDMPPHTWSMEGMADAAHETLAGSTLTFDRLHILAHSMGGAVGLLLVERHNIPLASFTNVEGNLVGADCGMLSRRTADMPLDDFRNGRFAKLVKRAREDEDPVLRQWAVWMETCAPDAFHACARSLVEWSDGGRLLEIFRSLRVPKTYVYGEKSANPDVLKHLDGIPTWCMDDCGHFPMIEKPGAFAAVMGTLVGQAVT